MDSMTVARSPLLSFDTTDPEFVSDPWPRYAEIRRMGGVIYNERINRWMVGGFDDVNDPNLRSMQSLIETRLAPAMESLQVLPKAMPMPIPH